MPLIFRILPPQIIVEYYALCFWFTFLARNLVDILKDFPEFQAVSSSYGKGNHYFLFLLLISDSFRQHPCRWYFLVILFSNIFLGSRQDIIAAWNRVKQRHANKPRPRVEERNCELQIFQFLSFCILLVAFLMYFHIDHYFSYLEIASTGLNYLPDIEVKDKPLLWPGTLDFLFVYRGESNGNIRYGLEQVVKNLFFWYHFLFHESCSTMHRKTVCGEHSKLRQIFFDAYHDLLVDVEGCGW